MSLNDTMVEGKHTFDCKLLVYVMFSAATLAECLLAGYITICNHGLRERLATSFSNSLIISIGIFSTLSFFFGVLLLTVPIFSYMSLAGCFVRMVQRYLSLVSCLTLTCLALDRYIAICRPLRYYNLITVFRCRLLCSLCWMSPIILLLLPCVVELPTMCNNGRTNMTFLVAYSVLYTIGAFINLVFYVLVALEFRWDYRTQPHSDDKEATEAVVRYKTARSALLVFMLYAILSLPHTLLPLASRILGQDLVPQLLVDGGHLIHRLHLLLFLPMYAWASNSFLASLKAWAIHRWRKITCSSPNTPRLEMAPRKASFVDNTSIGTL
ncbi:olfactory receptor 11G2-like [Homarus americanus]|uniref:Olfactory receptor 11H12-like n=1 Tax=Homarus americanus TaxID=6706 RepID=A0A8J5SZJ9_HOMAM|nr:olfactory receptor 11G2-like [Homarus americanus]KAG7171466.1 Olfactory receptor 11H12-like [Homarus americanus]